MNIKQFRNSLKFVALANFSYFWIEFAVATTIGSVSLFADSIDFLEDASVNFLILIALGWSGRSRAKTGMLLAIILMVPGISTLYMAWEKFHTLTPPAPLELSITGVGALIVNVACAYILARYRNHHGSLTKAAFLSARNDALANIAIISTGMVTYFSHSGWPDLVVGIGIAIMNADAAREVWETARNEHKGERP